MSRVTSVIMAYVKSDRMKQSVDNLEKYRLFTEDKLKLPLTVQERNNLVVYARSFLPVWYRTGVSVGTECLPIVWYILDWFCHWFLHFSWIRNYKNKQTLCIHQFIFDTDI